MKIDNYDCYDVEKLKAIPIKNVASQFGRLKYSGSTCMTLCPWHDDHHPSLSLVERNGKNYCHCFSCDEGGDVIDYVKAVKNTDFRGACEWLSNQYGILTVSNNSYVPKYIQKTVREPDVNPTYSYIPKEMLNRLVTVENPLCQCLLKLFEPQKVEWIVEEYRIGCYELSNNNSCTIFPSIDYTGNVCNLKVQCYDTDLKSPQFAHSQKGTCYWLGPIWVREGRLPANTHYTTKTLFGEHLLPAYPAQTVVLVESPKNALVGALEHPQMLWLATGNKEMLKREYMEPLRDREVIVIPDCDAVDEWKQTVSTMHDIANFTVSDFCRRMAPADKPKYDIADYIIDEHLKGI